MKKPELLQRAFMMGPSAETESNPWYFPIKSKISFCSVTKTCEVLTNLNIVPKQYDCSLSYKNTTADYM